MLRAAGLSILLGILTLAGCGHSAYAVRTVPRIAKDNVGKPVSRLLEAFGEPRKIDQASSKLLYVWYIAQKPPGAPTGFHGCEMEVSVDPSSHSVLGYSLSNIGWAKCAEVERKIRVAER